MMRAWRVSVGEQLKNALAHLGDGASEGDAWRSHTVPTSLALTIASTTFLLGLTIGFAACSRQSRYSLN